VLKDHPGAIILALGDNAYNRGKEDEYRDYYTPTWGQPDLLGRTYSCPGNHDYRTAAASPYFTYFGDQRAGHPHRSYYSLPLPEAGWHFVSLNSEIDQDAHSPQVQWLRQDLAARRFKPIIAIWHRPRWGSGAHRDSKKAALVLERAVRQPRRVDPQRARAPLRALRAAASRSDPRPQRPRMFVVGTGGRRLAGRTKDTPNSEYARFDKYGILKLTLRPESYRWEFLSTDDRIIDTGEQPVNPRESAV
jgi:hypothetical protein